MDWELYRNNNGTLDLFQVLYSVEPHKSLEWYDAARNYINSVAKLQPVKSRQVAAHVVATAITLANLSEVISK